MNANDLKLFRFADCDTVAALSVDEAVAFYLEETGLSREEIEPVEEDTGSRERMVDTGEPECPKAGATKL